MLIPPLPAAAVLSVAAAVAAVSLVADALHARRVRRIARLAFGPGGRPAAWVALVPAARALALGALAWGLLTLAALPPQSHGGARGALDPGELRHVVLVLDVSPSMRLVDAGPAGDQSRMQRTRDVMESFFRRVPLEQFRISVLAVYNGCKTVVVDTQDIDVVRNILGDLPMHYAFRAGQTRLFDGLEQAADVARPWNPGSTTLVVITDGDTVPAQGMPRMPASVADVLVIGVGDPVAGTFIDGRQSRQEAAKLRQIATRLRGRYHDGNARHLASSLIGEIARTDEPGAFERLTRREYALLACVLGAAIQALLPLLLHVFGTRWRPGLRPASTRERAAAAHERGAATRGRAAAQDPRRIAVSRIPAET